MVFEQLFQEAFCLRQFFEHYKVKKWFSAIQKPFGQEKIIFLLPDVQKFYWAKNFLRTSLENHSDNRKLLYDFLTLKVGY